MKKALRLAAVLIMAGSVGFWAATGCHRGWTQTNIKREVPDPVTGLVGVTYEKGFIPGLDFLGGMALMCGGILGFSFLIREEKPGK